ncbi:unnamed protein product [Ascophyllum nodosum]
MAADEITNLNGGVPMERRRLSWRGALAVFLASFGVFALAIVGARSVFPRSVTGRASSSSNLQVVSLVKVDDPVLSEGEVSPTLAPVHVTTQECTGNRYLPAVRGVDLVAYFSLEQGQPAVYGSDKHSTEYHGYLFFFSSLQNKIIFESNPAKYLPAWGGFCSYGISHEIVWDPEILGPKSNPDFWLIIDDQLYLFRSSVPLGKFTTNMYQNINHGNAVWHEWFGADDRDVNTMTPFNTACFCTTDTCVDQ